MYSSTDLRVKELLREKSWTTKQLAEKTGMSESYLTHIKNGTRRWNEDILRRLAVAFEIHPVDLFSSKKTIRSSEDQSIASTSASASTLTPRMVPVMKDIPTHPSPYNNQVMQITSGYRDVFVPVLGLEDEDAFCICIENNNMKPKFSKGDYVIVSPLCDIRSGDVVAVEYGNATKIKAIMQATVSDDMVILEAVNHQQSPIALIRNKDYYRFIGKAIFKYQKID